MFRIINLHCCLTTKYSQRQVLIAGSYLPVHTTMLFAKSMPMTMLVDLARIEMGTCSSPGNSCPNEWECGLVDIAEWEAQKWNPPKSSLFTIKGYTFTPFTQ